MEGSGKEVGVLVLGASNWVINAWLESIVCWVSNENFEDH